MDIARGKYLALSDSSLSEIERLSNAAYDEISKQVLQENPNISESERIKETRARFADIGGNFTNFIKHHGLTQRNIRDNAWLRDTIEQITSVTGIAYDQIFDRVETLITDEEELSNITQSMDEAEKKVQEQDKKIESLKQQEVKMKSENKTKKPSAKRQSASQRLAEQMKQAQEDRQLLMDQLTEMRSDQETLTNRIAFNNEKEALLNEARELSANAYFMNTKSKIKEGTLSPGQAFVNKQRVRGQDLTRRRNLLEQNKEYQNL